MRKPRVTSIGAGYYHVYSRLAGGRFLLTDPEKSCLLGYIRRAAMFSGVTLFTFGIMDNHFHLLIHVEAPRHVPDEELRTKVACLYGADKADKVFSKWKVWEDAGRSCDVEKDRARYRARMFDLSQFVKTFKESFTKDYNKRNEFVNSPWGSRFESVLVEGAAAALLRVAAYIDLSPVRAGVVKNPAAAPWTGFGATMHNDLDARDGLVSLFIHAYGVGKVKWDEAIGAYESVLDGKIEADFAIYAEKRPERKTGNPHFDVGKVKAAIAEGRRLSDFELLRCRVKFFTAGGVLGSSNFIQRLKTSIDSEDLAPHTLDAYSKSGLCIGRRIRRKGIVSIPLPPDAKQAS